MTDGGYSRLLIRPVGVNVGVDVCSCDCVYDCVNDCVCMMIERDEYK